MKHASNFRRKPEDGDAVGFTFAVVVRVSYSKRKFFQRDWQTTLKQAGYEVGVANTAMFYNAEERCRDGIHGDDFVVVGSLRALDRIGKTLSGKYSMRESH